MQLGTFLTLLRTGRLRTLGALVRASTSFYRIAFLVGAARAGLLAALREGAATEEIVADRMGVPEGGRALLAAWLEVGERLGEVARDAGKLRLSGVLARALASPENDDVLALLEEQIDLHRRLVIEAPALAASGRRLTLDDQDGRVIARSSRLLEPLVREAIASVVPETGALRLLEIGCGSGTYVRYCLERNRELVAVARELQPDVAEQARRNLEAWGLLGPRVQIESGDFRERPVGEPFDLATMHNNVYYFAERERVALFARVREHLRPGGRLLVTTGCRGGSPAMAVLSLWGAATEGCSPLPRPDELVRELRAAGYDEVRAENLAKPTDEFFAFVARRA